MDKNAIETNPQKELIGQQIRNSFKPIAELMDDPEVTDIFVYGPEDVSFIRQGGCREKTALGWESEKDLRIAVSQLGRYLKRKIDERSPILDSRLPDGSRVNVVIHPCYPRGVCMTIRKFPEIRFAPDDLVRLGTLDRRSLELLREAVTQGRNILISGGTGTGKTTLLNVLASFIGENDSVVTIEDAREIQLGNRYWAALERKEATSSEDLEVSIRDLLKNALRMNPRWVIVGEVRGEEVVDLLRAFNTGHSGISTIHANNCRDALFALEVLMMNCSHQRVEAIRMMISRVIHVVVQLGQLPDRSRKVMEIAKVTGITILGGMPEIVLESMFALDAPERRGENAGNGARTGGRYKGYQ